MAISQMAAGDGMADIIGRKFGSAKWPFSKDKSYAGTYLNLARLAVYVETPKKLPVIFIFCYLL